MESDDFVDEEPSRDLSSNEEPTKSTSRPGALMRFSPVFPHPTPIQPKMSEEDRKSGHRNRRSIRSWRLRLPSTSHVFCQDTRYTIPTSVGPAKKKTVETIYWTDQRPDNRRRHRFCDPIKEFEKAGL